jgi:hypothetical protein
LFRPDVDGVPMICHALSVDDEPIDSTLIRLRGAYIYS